MITPHRLRGRRVGRGLLVFATLLALSGCAQTGVLKRADLPARVNPSVVLLMKPDVELTLLTAAGLQEPNAEWTAKGLWHVEASLDKVLGERNADLERYHPPSDDPQAMHRHNQIQKLYRAVGAAVLQHRANTPLALPTKSAGFNWTLGSEVRVLREGTGADYALFVYLRDSYASAGRVATMIVMAAFGVGVQGGVQLGFASLVDLRTGNLVWFNQLVSTAGDLRAREPAEKAVAALLTDIPL